MSDKGQKRKRQSSSKGDKSKSKHKKAKKNPKIPPQVMKSLKERHPDLKKKKELEDILIDMANVVMEAYQDGDRLFYWSKPEREAVLYIAANKLVDSETMERIFADIKSCDEAVSKMTEPQREALALFPKLLGKVFDDISKEDFVSTVEAIPEKHSAKACKELMSMVDCAIDITKDQKASNSAPLKDLGNFKSNAVSDILKSLFDDFAMTNEKALSRLELVKKSLVVG
jgi:hypothetical protein